MRVRVWASSAENGSSSSSTAGSTASARAMPTRWRMPPESWCGYLASKPAQAGHARGSAACARARSKPRDAQLLEAELHVGPHGAPGKERELLEHGGRHRPARARARPRSRRAPQLAGKSPPMMLSSVDLPQPDGPSMATNSSGSTAKVDLAQRDHVPAAPVGVGLATRARRRRASYAPPQRRTAGSCRWWSWAARPRSRSSAATCSRPGACAPRLQLGGERVGAALAVARARRRRGPW